jgi:class 3 adenylate cyclase
MRIGLHHGRPRKVAGDYLGVDVNIAARVGAQAKAGEVLVSQPTFERLEGLAGGRARRLRAEGAPRDLRVVAVSRG